MANLTAQTKSEQVTDGYLPESKNSSTGALVPDEAGRLPNAIGEDAQSLTETELRQAIIHADNNKNDLKMQRELGLALFQYSLSKKDSKLIPDSIRLLERAAERDAAINKDVFIYQAIGDGWFVLGRENQVANGFERARKSYLKALKIDSANSNLLVGIGQTYFYQTKPDFPFAIKYFNKALKISSQHEKALEGLAGALIETNELEQAAVVINVLRQLSVNNELTENLQLMLARRKIMLNV